MKVFSTALALATVLLVVSVMPAFARKGSGQDGANRWTGSFAVISGVTFQDWDASVSSLACRGCTIPDPLMGEETLRPGATGDDLDTSPFVGANIELMTPELPLRSSPRFFVGAEVAGAFGIQRKLAQNGVPGTIANPAPDVVQDQTSFTDISALGQGSETVATLGELTLGAQVGIAFPLSLYGRTLRIKPGVAWIRYEVDIEGLVVDADCQPRITNTECNATPPQNGFLRETRLFANTTETYDGIGPSLEIEMDTGRLGPLGTSIFLGARVYRILGDREIELDAGLQTFDDLLGQDSASARFTFEVDEWMHRVGVGLRFQWLGFDRSQQAPQ